MKKQNCWEFMQCGREKGGKMEEKLGICPAAEPGRGSGYNHGKFRGRICWAVAGTFCDGIVSGSFAKKYFTCLECPFYKKVVEEEGDSFDVMLPIELEKDEY